MVSRNSRRPNRMRYRLGVTILEVMFAIFVAIVGLLGIASLIPLASRNASDSNAFNVALTQGKVWANDFFARRFAEPESYTNNSSGYNWQWLNDADNTPGFFPVGYFNFQKSYPIGGAAVTFSSTNTSSSDAARLWGHQAVCLDPLFMSSSDVGQMIGSGVLRTAAYRPAVFPYYEDNYNPLTDAFSPTSLWTDQPRMVRVTLGLDDDTSATSLRMTNKLVNEIFVSKDDILGFQNKGDKTQPTQRVFNADGPLGAQYSPVGKTSNNGDFSWMATIVPEEQRPSSFTPFTSASPSVAIPSRNYTVTVMVYRKRDRAFNVVGQPPGVAELKPGGERLVWVYPLSGNFIGGNGGRVRLVTDANSSSKVHVGDWILLGKHYLIDPTAPAHRYGRFHWYRIVALDSDPRLDIVDNVVPTGTDPYGNQGMPVWSRDVVLEGADWDFTPGITSGGVTYPTPTTGTLMSHVVTVIEANVTVE